MQLINKFNLHAATTAAVEREFFADAARLA